MKLALRLREPVSHARTAVLHIVFLLSEIVLDAFASLCVPSDAHPARSQAYMHTLTCILTNIQVIIHVHTNIQVIIYVHTYMHVITTINHATMHTYAHAHPFTH